jgi:hypothetical protein
MTKSGKPPVTLKRLVIRYELQTLSDTEKELLEAAI